MALETVTAQITGVEATQTVYTCPAGKTARIVQSAIRNSTSPAADTEFTVQFVDSEATATTFNLLSAARIIGNADSYETVSVFQEGFTLNGGDQLKIAPGSGGSLDVTITFDVLTETLVTKAYNLVSGTDTNLVGDDTQGYRIITMMVSNASGELEKLNLHWSDSSSIKVYELAHNMSIAQGILYYPLFGELGIAAGDRLRARSDGADLTLAVTYAPDNSLRSAGYELGSAAFTTIASAASGTRRVAYCGICNTGTAAETVTLQFVNASESNETVGFVVSMEIPAGFTAYPISGDLALNTGDMLQARGSGSALTAVVCMEA